MGATEPCQDTIRPEGGPGSCIRSLLSVAASDEWWCSVQTLDIEIKVSLSRYWARLIIIL